MHLRCMNFALFDSYRKLMEIGTNWVDKWELDNLCWMEVFQMVKLSYIHCFLAVLRSQIVLEVTICSRFDICFLIFWGWNQFCFEKDYFKIEKVQWYSEVLTFKLVIKIHNFESYFVLNKSKYQHCWEAVTIHHVWWAKVALVMFLLMGKDL